MFMVLYTTLWLLSAVALLVFGFLAGRFARKLPVIDDALPWTLHWREILPSSAHTEESSEHFPGAPTWPRTAVFAVPFLVRMALDPRQVNRHRIVSLVGSIAIGLDNNYLSDRYDPEEDRAYLARMRGEAGGMAQWIAEAEDDEQRTQRGVLRAGTHRR